MALADALMRRVPSAEVTALGTEYGLEATLVPGRGYPIHMIPRVAMPRHPTLSIATLPARMLKAVRATSAILHVTRPDVVVGFGGYVSLPAYLAARRGRIPIVVHEANAKPGLANRVGARFTKHVAISSSKAQLPHGQLIGIPLRRAIATLDRAAMRSQARASFGLDDERPTLLVFGGSQGARSINDALTAALPALRREGIQVLHAVGPGNELLVGNDMPAANSAMVKASKGQEVAVQAPYVAVAYLEDMELAYAAADVALCRSGAMTCAELAAVGLPGVFVPYPHSNGEQELNALPLVEHDAGVLLGDDNLDDAAILDAVVPMLTDSDRLGRMSANAASLGRKDADERLTDLVLAAAKYS